MQLPERLVASWETRGYARLRRFVLTLRRGAATLVRSILRRTRRRRFRYRVEARLRAEDHLHPRVPLVRNRH